MQFDDYIIEMVWRKGIIDPGYNGSVYRKDSYGSWMKRDEYGNRDSNYGWEIDHILPVSRNGSDALSNLQPLYWRNNASKQDGLI